MGPRTGIPWAARSATADGHGVGRWPGISSPHAHRSTIGQPRSHGQRTMRRNLAAQKRGHLSAAPHILAPQKSEEGPRRAPRGFALSRARRWSAASCSPTGWTGSTIGARGLNFRVRHGTGCSPPAMAADRRRARGGRVASAPSGPHSDAKRSSRTVPGKNGGQELGLLVPLG